MHNILLDDVNQTDDDDQQQLHPCFHSLVHLDVAVAVDYYQLLHELLLRMYQYLISYVYEVLYRHLLLS